MLLAMAKNTSAPPSFVRNATGTNGFDAKAASVTTPLLLAAPTPWRVAFASWLVNGPGANSVLPLPPLSRYRASSADSVRGEATSPLWDETSTPSPYPSFVASAAGREISVGSGTE